MKPHRMLVPAALLALATATVPARAEIKTDGLWRGTGALAFSATSGNTRSSSLLLNADALRATTQNKVTLGAAATYARNKDGDTTRTTANRWGAFGQYDQNLTARLFAFGRLALDGDELVDLNLRSTVAAGLGYKLVDTKPATVEVFAGGAYSTDRYDTAQTIGDRTGTSFSRASVYLGESGSYQISPSTSFKQRLDLYPGLSGDKALLAKLALGLNVAMSSTLGLNVGVIDTYNSKPPAGAKKNDLSVFTGISVKFGAD